MLNKKLFLVYLLILTTLFVVIGCDKKDTKSEESAEKTSFNPESVRAAIEAKNAEFVKAMMAGDSNAVVNNFYSDDARLLFPGAEKVSGKSEISKIIGSYAKNPMKEFKTETVAVSGNEENLIEEGTYFIGDGKGNVLDKGKYINIFKKVGNDWKCHTDIWNSSMPPPEMKK